MNGLVKTLATLGLTSLIIIIFILFFYDPYKPLHQLEEPLTIADDHSMSSLLTVVERQKNYFENIAPDSTVDFGELSIPNSWLLSSIEELHQFLQHNPAKEELSHFLKTHYDFYQAGGRSSKLGRKMLVTGYYEPLFEGSYERSPSYATPLYRLPSSLVTIKNESGGKKLGRYDEDRSFSPFWTRGEIEEEGHLVGNELVYLKDSFDAYLLHVQGSGRIRFPDGSIKAIGYAGNNGHDYMSIGKILVEKDIMKLEDVDIPAIRQYLQDNPEQLKELLYQNPRYIFFQWGDTRGPVGSSGEPLTPGRSIAIDPDSLPTGTIAYLRSEKPIIEDGRIISWEPLNRLVFPQDKGSAIKGTGRVDLFWGNGQYAETAANHMKHPGELFFLVKKGFNGKTEK